MEQLSILWTLASASIRSELQYRANAVTSIISGLLYQISGFLVVWLVVAKFNSLGGWSLAEITFLYGMRLTSHGIFYACFSQMFELDRVLISGEFDRFMLRPMPTLLQMFTRKLKINGFGDLVGGSLLLTAASFGSAVDWSPRAVVFLLCGVFGGALVEGAVQISLGSMSFRFLNTLALRTTVNEVFNLYGNYPFTIFPKVLEYLLTFALPVAFVAFMPASILVDQKGSLHVPVWLAVAAPLVGACLFLIAIRIWDSQSKHYQSAGT